MEHLSGGAEWTGVVLEGRGGEGEGEGEIHSIIVLWFSLTPAYKPPLVAITSSVEQDTIYLH